MSVGTTQVWRARQEYHHWTIPLMCLEYKWALAKIFSYKIHCTGIFDEGKSKLIIKKTAVCYWLLSVWYLRKQCYLMISCHSSLTYIALLSHHILLSFNIIFGILFNDFTQRGKNERGPLFPNLPVLNLETRDKYVLIHLSWDQRMSQDMKCKIYLITSNNCNGV